MTNLSPRMERTLGVLTGLVLALLSLLLLALSLNAFKAGGSVGRVSPDDRVVSVSGTSSVRLTPDIATVRIGMSSKKPSVQEAQKDNTDKTNALIEALKKAGVGKDDLQTEGYNVYEEYDWVDGRQTSRGWNASQSLVVTIRDLDTISTILSLAGDHGAANISGPDLSIEHPEDFVQDARKDAIKKAREQAEDIAKALDVKLIGITQYSESTPGQPPIYSYAKAEAAMDGYGGGPAPTIAPGSEEIQVTVSITYELGR